MLGKYRTLLTHIVETKIKNRHFTQKIMALKATIVLITLIIGILLTRTYLYIADSQIMMGEKVTDLQVENELSLENMNTSVEKEHISDKTDYNTIETQENVTETQETVAETQKIDDKNTDQEYIYSASLDKYYDLDAFNRLTIDDLMCISGIGEVTANAIFSYREKNGAFHSFSELLNIKGIGEKKLKKWIVSKP